MARLQRESDDRKLVISGVAGAHLTKQQQRVIEFVRRKLPRICHVIILHLWPCDCVLQQLAFKGVSMFMKFVAALAAVSLIVPGTVLAFGTSTPTTYTDMHWVAGAGATVPSPAACGSITDIRLDVTLNKGSSFFTASGEGSCTNTSDFLIFTGSGVVEGSTAWFNLYFGNTRLLCGVSVPGYAGTCDLYLLGDFSLASEFDVTLTATP
jgi:hypothetical protein